jgi:hypothetical protein
MTVPLLAGVVHNHLLLTWGDNDDVLEANWATMS